LSYDAENVIHRIATLADQFRRHNRKVIFNDITVVNDCHTTANRPSCSVKTLIDSYNWLWADLTQTKYKIKVIPAADILID